MQVGKSTALATLIKNFLEKNNPKSIFLLFLRLFPEIFTIYNFNLFL